MFAFGNRPFENLLSSYSDVMQVDIDNHSDKLTASMVHEALQHADKIFVYLETEGTGSLGVINEVLRKLIFDNKDGNYTVYYKGGHPSLDLMMKRVNDKLIKSDEDITNSLKSFLL